MYKPFPFEVVIPSPQQIAAAYKAMLQLDSTISWVDYYNSVCGWCALIGEWLIPLSMHKTIPDAFVVEDLSVSMAIYHLQTQYADIGRHFVATINEPLYCLCGSGSGYVPKVDSIDADGMLLSDGDNVFKHIGYYKGASILQVVESGVGYLDCLKNLANHFSSIIVVGSPIPVPHALTRYKSYYKVCMVECRPIEMLRLYIKSMRETKKEFCLSVDNILGGYSMEVAKSDRDIVVLPSLNTIQYGCNYNAPYAYALEHLALLPLKEGEFYCCYPPSFDYCPSMKTLTQLGKVHSDAVASLEYDRMVGKIIAEDLGYCVPYYRLVQQGSTLDDCRIVLSAFNQPVVLKYNTGRFLGKFGCDCADTLYEYVKKGDVMVEECISSVSGSYEVNLSFYARDGKIEYMLYLFESCKMMANDSGGKIGLSMSVHFAPNTPYEGLLNLTPLIGKMQRLPEVLAARGQHGLSGWFDISLMLGGDGDWYFTEWMFRNGVSNFAIINMWNKTNYMDMVMDSRKPVFPSPFVISCEVVLTFYGGGHDEAIRIKNPVRDGKPAGFCCSQISLTRGLVDIYFCPLEAGHVVGEYIVPPQSATVRLGVFNAHFSSCKDVGESALEELACTLDSYIRSLDVPNSAYRLDLTTIVPRGLL